MSKYMLGDMLVGGVNKGPSESLVGEVVTMMLYNGIVVTGVRLITATPDELTYQLPTAQGVSQVPTYTVAYLYVHAYMWRTKNDDRAPITIHVGDVAPDIR